MYNTELLNEHLNSILAGSFAIIGIVLIIVVAYLIFYLVCLSKLFKKAGKKGWEAIVPYYSTYVLVEIAGLNWWYFLIAISGSIITLIGLESLSFITTLAGWAVNFFVFYNLAKKMHKEPIGIAIGGTLVPGIMIIILGLSKNYEYDNSVEVSPNGPIGDNKEVSNKNTTPERFCLGCGQKLKPNVLFCENCGKKVE